MKMPYSGRDLLLIGIFLVLTGLAAVGSFHAGKVDFGVWFFGLGIVVVLFRPVLRRRPVYTAGRPQKTVSRKERVEFDEREIRRYLSDGRTESIAWEDIDEIGIVTTDEGPWVDDLFWLFTGESLRAQDLGRHWHVLQFLRTLLRRDYDFLELRTAAR